MEKIKERTNKYGISIRVTSNGYYEARISIKLGGGNSKRLQKGGKTEELAILSLLTALEEYLEDSYQKGLIICKLEDIMSQRLIQSINNIGIISAEITEKALVVAHKINNINAQILNKVNLPSKVVPFCNTQNIGIEQQQELITAINNIQNTRQIQNNKNYIIEDVAIEWKKYELQLCIKSEDNPRPLCQKTADGYIRILNSIILPFFKKKKICYIKQITVDILNKLFKSVNGYQGKRNTYIVLSLFSQYLINQQIITESLLQGVKKPVKPAKSEEDDIKVIEVENQKYYLEAFEKENTDMALLFETMLLTGIRPEEACGLKNSSLHKYYVNNEEKYELIINNAYKDFIVYDDEGNQIGHERRDDRLKNEQSYRSIPINNKFAEKLLAHKEKQKKIFKTSKAVKRKNRKWSENEYMFLSRTYMPYVSDTLSSGLPKLCEKYNLERVSPYVLRHSFATYCFEKGMKELTLMKIMAHSSFETTHRYYIRVSKKIKEREMEEVFKEVFYERKAS